MARYTLTARYEGAWRWASFDVGTDRTAVKRADEVIKTKVKNGRDMVKNPVDDGIDWAETVEVWSKGGVTLSNPKGHIIWTRPAKT